MPLALELAAARASVLTVEQIVERLSQRLDLFTGGRDADPRQQTLRTTIEWSHDLLSEDERWLFARLAVFVGGCTLDAAEEVVNADIAMLQALVDKSLVRRTGERLWMLETIREYALERLDESPGKEAVERRHTDFFLALAREAEIGEQVQIRSSGGIARAGSDNIRRQSTAPASEASTPRSLSWRRS